MKNFFQNFDLWVFSLLFTLLYCIKGSVRAIPVAGKLFKNRFFEKYRRGVYNDPRVEKHSLGHYLSDPNFIFSIFGPEHENRQKQS